jgi:hypothetical protein
MHMQQSVSVALLAFAILAVPLVQAQRGGGAMFHGPGPGVFGRPSPGVFGHGCCPGHRIFPHPFGRLDFPGVFVTAPYYPFWYDEPSSYDQPNYQPPASAPEALTTMPPNERPAAAAPANPKIIDVPGSVEKAAGAKPRVPVVFVLTNGERLEARRYTLTADFLDTGSNGQRRHIPVAALDREATLAANRQRGIELKFPSDPNEISLGF